MPTRAQVLDRPAWPPDGERFCRREAARALARLSPREREVLRLLVARHTDREIAEVLGISYRTATTHVARIFDKLGVNARREAEALAWRGDAR